jgi:Icc-related predicted phosphoesterase
VSAVSGLPELPVDGSLSARAAEGGGRLRVCCVADLHGRIPADVPECDLLLIAGDVSPHDPSDNAQFFQRSFPDWLRRQPAGRIVGIAGNHDFLARAQPGVFRELPWTYLENQLVEIAGLKIAGSPWTPLFGFWAFMASEPNLARIWANLPDDLEILLSHGPPRGYTDLTADGIHAGSTSLRDRVLELTQLRLHCCGHIHGGYGTASLPNGAIVANASLLDERYELVNAPVVVDLQLADRDLQP